MIDGVEKDRGKPGTVGRAVRREMVRRMGKEQVNGEDRTAQDPRVADVSARRKGYEERFAKSFLLPEKRGRFVRIAVDRELLPKLNRKTAKRRSKFRTILGNFEHWVALGKEDVKWCPSEPGVELLRSLLDLGAPKECYVLSVSRAWDGRFGDLKEVIQVFSDRSVGTSLVICLPRSLAYYYNEEMADLSAILRKVDS